MFLLVVRGCRRERYLQHQATRRAARYLTDLDCSVEMRRVLKYTRQILPTPQAEIGFVVTVYRVLFCLNWHVPASYVPTYNRTRGN